MAYRKQGLTIPAARSPWHLKKKLCGTYVYSLSEKAVAFTALYCWNIKINEHGRAAEHVNKLTQFKVFIIEPTLRVHVQPSSHDLAAICHLCKEWHDD
jgi:hypothetical protein